MLGRFNKIQIYLLGFCLLCALPSTLAAESLQYTVKKGDTLYGIAKRFSVPLQALKDANRLKDTDSLLPGAVIQVPGLYTVQKGDTLFGIARKFGMSLDELLAASGRKKDQPLNAGDQLYIPQAKAPAAVAAKPAQDVPAVKAPAAALPAVSAAKPAVQPEIRKVTTGLSRAGEGELYYWPVDGERSFQDGKLPRIVIQGTSGDRIVSIAPGKIIWVGVWGIFGKTVFVQSKTGYVYIYAGSTSVTVKVGDEIERGMTLGTLGQSQNDTTPVLHFFVYKDGKPVHPEKAPRG